MTNVNIVSVNYRANGPALTGVITGEVQIMFPTAGSVAPHIKSGRVRALAVATLTPSELFPALPTVAATVPGFQAETDTGLLVPIGTPAAIVSRLNQETVKVLQRSDVKKRFFDASVEVVGNSPDEFTALMKTESSRLGKVIKDAGIKG
jgi:tripartite-type tricarboxylate transporter receptor subunit TctC